MLVLTRKPGEQIQIGDNVALTVIEIRGGRVRLGITAPSQIPVYREEIYRRIDGGYLECAINDPHPCSRGARNVEVLQREAS